MARIRPFAFVLAAAATGAALGVLITLLVDTDEPQDEERERLQADLNHADERIDELETALAATPTPSPEASPEPDGDGSIPPDFFEMPPEDAGWNPCDTAGLCEFAAELDAALQSRNADAILQKMQWVDIDCNSEDSVFSGFGVYPVECRSWPFDTPIPTIGLGRPESEGFPASQWDIYETLSSYAVAAEADCGGNQAKVEVRVRAIISPPDPDFYWTGEKTVMIGPPLGCRLYVPNPTSGDPYTLALNRDESGSWVITSMLAAATGPQYLKSAFYTDEFRTYPLSED